MCDFSCFFLQEVVDNYILLFFVQFVFEPESQLNLIVLMIFDDILGRFS